MISLSRLKEMVEEEMENKIKDLELALKRKEQECEQLRETIHKDICTHYVLGECSQKHHNNCVGRNQCIKDLEQECEELKETFDGLFKVQYKLADNNKKLRQCLTEIKEIALWKEEYWSMPTSEYISIIDEILQKISECEGNNETN